jgi:hypothetical protein
MPATIPNLPPPSEAQARRLALMQQMPIEQYCEYLREDPKSMMMGYLPERVRSPEATKALPSHLALD